MFVFRLTSVSVCFMCVCSHAAGMACRHPADPHPLHMAADAGHFHPQPRTGGGPRLACGGAVIRRPAGLRVEVGLLSVFGGLFAGSSHKSFLLLGVVMVTSLTGSRSLAPAVTLLLSTTVQGLVIPDPRWGKGQRLDMLKAEPGMESVLPPLLSVFHIRMWTSGGIKAEMSVLLLSSHECKFKYFVF